MLSLKRIKYLYTVQRSQKEKTHTFQKSAQAEHHNGQSEKSATADVVFLPHAYADRNSTIFTVTLLAVYTCYTHVVRDRVYNI